MQYITNQDYLSRKNTELMKGILAIGVLLHHIWQKTHIGVEPDAFGFFMQSLGYYCVTGFFFILGYGLKYSFENREGYLDDFQSKRVLPVFVINLTLVFIYAIEKVLLGFELTWPNILLSCFWGGNVVTFGWYLLVILVFYEFFFFAHKYSRRKEMSLLALVIIYMLLCFTFNKQVWWWISSLAFPAGVYYYKCKNQIEKWINNNSFFVVSGAIMLYLLTFLYLFGLFGKIPGSVGSLIHIGLSTIHGLLFFSLILLFLMRHSLRGKVLAYVSSMYLEIYVMQGFMMIFLRNPHWTVSNNYIFAILVFVGTFLLALIIKPLFKYTVSVIKK